MEKSQCPGGDNVHNKCPGLDNIQCCKSVCVEEVLVESCDDEEVNCSGGTNTNCNNGKCTVTCSGGGGAGGVGGNNNNNDNNGRYIIFQSTRLTSETQHL